MDVKRIINLRKVNILKTFLFPKMIYPSSVICTPYEVIKEYNSLIFRFLHHMTKVALKC